MLFEGDRIVRTPAARSDAAPSGRVVHCKREAHDAEAWSTQAAPQCSAYSRAAA